MSSNIQDFWILNIYNRVVCCIHNIMEIEKQLWQTSLICNIFKHACFDQQSKQKYVNIEWPIDSAATFNDTRKSFTKS